MATRNVATVFGGAGFIGRYVVQRLAAKGYVVRVAARRPDMARFLMTSGQVGQVVPLAASIMNEAESNRAIAGAELVVNLVGLLAEPRAGDFHRIHAEGAARVARLSAAAGVQSLVQLSAIGADLASPSQYGRTKAEGERDVRAAFPDAVVLRPSVVFGAEDKFFNMFGRMAELLPVMPVIRGATRFQPVYVGDVADAVIAGLTRPDAKGCTFALGGPRVLTFRELLRYVLAETRRSNPMIAIPDGLAALQARLGELVPGKPFTRDQFALLSRDNVVAEGEPGLESLGIVPTPLELIVPGYLDRYRRGGGKRDVTPGQELPIRP